MHLFLVDVVNDGYFHFDSSLPLHELRLIEDNYMSYFLVCQVGEALSFLPYVGASLKGSLCLCADHSVPSTDGRFCERPLTTTEQTMRSVQVDPLRYLPFLSFFSSFFFTSFFLLPSFSLAL